MLGSGTGMLGTSFQTFRGRDVVKKRCDIWCIRFEVATFCCEVEPERCGLHSNRFEVRDRPKGHGAIRYKKSRPVFGQPLSIIIRLCNEY